jgi:hypothetical protein
MTFEFRNLGRLGTQLSISIPKDSEGFLGRECPQEGCEGYFKIKPGTGLLGDDLPCHCPYCGHEDSQDHFWTKDQVEYVNSIALRDVANAIHRDLKSLEFEHKPRGAFGIGISMKLMPGSPVPIRHYREKDLETKITCDQCTLEYAVYGVFGYCPDCAAHNSLLILQKNLDLTRKQLALAEKLDEPALRQHLFEDALENCVSAFDGFAREACRIRADKSSDPAKCVSLSFQNLPRAGAKLQSLFGIDLAPSVPPDIWSVAHTAFMQRHLLAHKAGVVDQQFLDETGQSRSLLGRRLNIAASEVHQLADAVMTIGQKLLTALPQLK